MGDTYTICDPYLFTIASWIEGDGVDTTKLPRVMEHRARMLARPAVTKGCGCRRHANQLTVKPLHLTHFVVVGAGAAGLMAARELVRAGKRVTILEARDRCGGRIYPLPAEEFGYPAEGGPEFVHGAAPVTRALMREAQTFAVAARRHAMEHPHGQVIAQRAFAAAYGSVLPGSERGESRSAHR